MCGIIPWLNRQDDKISGSDWFWFDRYVSPGRYFPLWAVSSYCHHCYSPASNAFPINNASSPEEVVGSAMDLLFGIGRGCAIWHIRMQGSADDINVAGIERQIYKWGVANENILMSSCKPFGGLPRERKPYGYSHCPANEQTGYLFIRNPFALPQKMELTLGEKQTDSL